MTMVRVLILSVLVLFAKPAFSAGGESSGGGGSAYSAEFIQLGYQAAKVAPRLPGFPVSAAAFLNAIQMTKVEFTHERLIDKNGIQEDALNFPDQGLIEVNIDRWQLYMFDTRKKLQLAVHEYLSIMRLDDSTYRFSSLVLEGGVRLRTMNCAYRLPQGGGAGTLVWYQVNIAGGNAVDSTAMYSTMTVDGANMQFSGNAIGGLASQGDAYGLSVAWNAFVVDFTAFIPMANINSMTEFSAPFYAMTRFSGNGQPAFQYAGPLYCKVKVN